MFAQKSRVPSSSNFWSGPKSPSARWLFSAPSIQTSLSAIIFGSLKM